MKFPYSVVILAFAVAWPAIAGPGAAASGLVNCLDPARALVTRRPAVACNGRIVDDAEADRTRRLRARRIMRQIDGAPPNLIPGRTRIGSGTGFYVSAAGHVLTNHHVVEACAAVSIHPPVGEAAEARVVGLDEANDLAVLDTGRKATAAAFRAGPSEQAGEAIAIIGYPLHGLIAIRPILTAGRVLGLASGPRAGPNRFHVKAQVRRGNSGGPVLDTDGRVVGVISAKVDTPRLFQMTGRFVRDVGLAIDAATVMGFLDRHGVTYIGDRTPGRGHAGRPPSAAETLRRARAFIVRIGCWK